MNRLTESGDESPQSKESTRCGPAYSSNLNTSAERAGR